MVALCALVACSPAAPSVPAPPASPTAVASPPETQLERQQRLDFEAAEKSYRAFSREYDRVSNAGGTDLATKIMKKTAGGPYLKVMTNFSSQGKASGWRSVGTVRIAYVRHGTYSPTQLSLNTCEDGTKIGNVDRRGRFVSHGLAVTFHLDLRTIDGRWKIWNGDDKVVKSCPN